MTEHRRGHCIDAGLHFTNPLIAKLKRQGVETAFVTLHVGLGTFAAVKTENLEQHQMHAEFYQANKQTEMLCLFSFCIVLQCFKLLIIDPRIMIFFLDSHGMKPFKIVCSFLSDQTYLSFIVVMVIVFC